MKNKEKKPFVFINAVMSIDGKISTIERKQVRISNKADLERVDRLRAESDAVLVGMNTVLVDDPKLTVKSKELRRERTENGKSENPMKVTIGRVDNLNLDSDFLNYGNAKVVIFTTHESDKWKIDELSGKAKIVISNGKKVNLRDVMKVLWKMGIRRLMVEGGGNLNFELIKEGLVDEVYIAIAPKIFGGHTAPTLVDGEGFEEGSIVKLKHIGSEKLDDILILKYRFEKSSGAS